MHLSLKVQVCQFVETEDLKTAAGFYFNSDVYTDLNRFWECWYTEPIGILNKISEY